MARLFNVTLAIFTVLLVRNEATRQDREKKLRKSQDVVKQQRFIEVFWSFVTLCETHSH